MPKYVFACQDCKKRFRKFLAFAEYDAGETSCPYCQSINLKQEINKVRFARSAESRLENMGAMDDLEGLEDDPKALGRMMRQMSREVGEDLPPEFDEVVSRLEKGQSPEEIEAEMPELADAMGEGGMGMGGGFGGADDLEDF